MLFSSTIKYIPPLPQLQLFLNTRKNTSLNLITIFQYIIRYLTRQELLSTATQLNSSKKNNFPEVSYAVNYVELSMIIEIYFGQMYFFVLFFTTLAPKLSTQILSNKDRNQRGSLVFLLFMQHTHSMVHIYL